MNTNLRDNVIYRYKDVGKYDIVIICDVVGCMLADPRNNKRELIRAANDKYGFRRTARMFYEYQFKNHLNPDLLAILHTAMKNSDFLPAAAAGMDILLGLPNVKVKMCSNYGLSDDFRETLPDKFNKRFDNKFTNPKDFGLFGKDESKAPFIKNISNKLSDDRPVVRYKLDKKFGLVLPETGVRYKEHEVLSKPYYQTELWGNGEIHYEARNTILYIIEEDRDNLSNYVYYAEHCKHYYNANGIECFPLDSKNEMRTCHITQPVLIGNPRKEETDREYVDVYPGMLDFATALQAAIRTNNYEFFAH